MRYSNRNPARLISMASLLTATILCSSCLSMAMNMVGTTGAPFRLLHGIDSFGFTEREIVKTMGREPDTRKNKILNGVKYLELTYEYMDSSAIADEYSVHAWKAQTFYIADKTVIGSIYYSSFAHDSTYIDMKKARQIKIGMTKDELYTLMGEPTGYRASATENGDMDEVTVLSYIYVTVGRNDVATKTITVGIKTVNGKSLVQVIDGDDG